MREEVDDYIEPEQVSLEELMAYDGSEALLPAPFTSRTLYIDATSSNPLLWKEEIAKAEEIVRACLKVLFDLDLGPFKHAASQALALETFYESLYTRFMDHTVGVILHRSNTPLSVESLSYLEELRSYLPSSLHCILCFDCEAHQDPLSFARLFSLDRFTRFTLALKDAPVSINACIWQKGRGRLGYIGESPLFQKEETPTLGILIPRSEAEANKCLNEKMQLLLSDKIAFKVISEELLALEWDGLDELIVQKHGLAPTTRRVLEGFSAAGGTVTELENLQ